MSSRDDKEVEQEKKTLMNSVAEGGRSDQSGFNPVVHETEEPRRSFVQKLSVAVGGLFASIPGVSKRVAANESPDLRKARKDYDSRKRVEAAIENHAGDLVKALASRDLLESESVSQLLGTDFTVSAVTVDGKPTAHIEIVKELSNGERLSLFVQPQAGRSYAIQKSKDYDTSASIYEFSAEDDMLVSPECTAGGGACYNTTCSDFPDYESYKETYCCTDGSCYTGSETECCRDGQYSGCGEVC